MSCPEAIDTSGMKSCDPKCKCKQGTLCPGLVYSCDKPCPEGAFFDPRSCDCVTGEWGLYLARTTFESRWATGCFSDEGLLMFCSNWAAADIGEDKGKSDTQAFMRYDPDSALFNPERKAWVKGSFYMNVNGGNPTGSSQPNTNTWVSAMPGDTITSTGNTVDVFQGSAGVLDVRQADITATDPSRVDPEIGGWAGTGTSYAVQYSAAGWGQAAMEVNLCEDPKMDEDSPRCDDGFYGGRDTWNQKTQITTTIRDYPMDKPEYELVMRQSPGLSVSNQFLYERSQEIRRCDNSNGAVDAWNAECDKLSAADRESLSYAACYSCDGNEGGGGDVGETALPGGNGEGYFTP